MTKPAERPTDERCPKCGGQIMYSMPERFVGKRLVIATNRELPYCWDLACGWEGEERPVSADV